MIKSDTKFFQGEIFNTMEDNFVTAVDPASKEMMATKENKSDLKLPYDVDTTLNDEGKMSDKKLQNEEDKVCVELENICKFTPVMWGPASVFVSDRLSPRSAQPWC